MKGISKILFVALLVAETAWGVLIAFGPAAKQERVFCCQGQSWFMDYKAPREWAVDTRHYHPENVGRWDVSCYPPINYDLVRLFPRDRVIGGLAMSAVGTLVFALAALLLARRLRTPHPAVATLLVLFSAPSLFCFSTGNPLPFALAGVCLFFAWKDESGWRRPIALLALSLAIALKVAPAMFALILLAERRGRDFILVGLVSAALVFVPFAWYGGLGQFRDFLACLKIRGVYYGIRESWGFVGLDRCLRLGLGLSVESTRATYPISRALNVLFAGGCLVTGWFALARPRECPRPATGLLPLSVALVMLPGGSVFYNSLFLVPALLTCLANPDETTKKESLLAAIAWFLLFSPLQIPFSFSAANVPLAALAMLLLGVSGCLNAREPGKVQLTNWATDVPVR